MEFYEIFYNVYLIKCNVFYNFILFNFNRYFSFNNDNIIVVKMGLLD